MTNHSTRVTILTTLTYVALGVGANAGSITYNIVAYPSITDPYTVSGTITTNGATGTALPASDITGWDINITNGPTNVFDFTPATSSNATNAFAATNTTLYLSPLLRRGIYFAQQNQTPTEDYDIVWVHLNSTVSNYFFQNLAIGQNLFSGSLPTINSPVASAASVPEPSTVVLAGSGALCALAYTHHRKQQTGRCRGDGGRTESTE